MMSIAGISATAEHAENLRTTLPGRLLAFEHEIGRTLTEIQSRTGQVKRTAMLLV